MLNGGIQMKQIKAVSAVDKYDPAKFIYIAKFLKST